MSERHMQKGPDVVGVITGESDIDISAAVYTGFIPLVTITPKGNRPLRDVEIVIDLAKATSGFAATHTSETLQLGIQRKVDRTNWRTEQGSLTTALAASAATAASKRLVIGTIGPQEEARVVVKLSAEAADCELPFVLYYNGEAEPTLTLVSA